MRILITYKGKTGFTKLYAEMVAEQVTCDLLAFKAAGAQVFSQYDTVVFGGRVHAGRIDGLRRAKKLFARSGAKNFVVFATGATPNDATALIDALWENNFSQDEREAIPHFYMQSGIRYEGMPPLDKAILKLAAKMMKTEQNKDANQEGFAQSIAQSHDISSKTFAEPLIHHLRKLI